MKLLNEILGTKYPIIQGGMANIATGEFAAACSNAGALGLIGAGGMNAETLRENIRRCKELTDKPFGVNIMLMHPQADEFAKIVVEEGVKVVTTGAGNPGKYIPMWKEAGIKVIPVVAAAVLAKHLAPLGVDAVIAEGTESGGHVGEMTTMALLKAQKGQFTGCLAPFGYRKDPEDKNHLLIDEETAPIVRLIFGYALNGHGPNYIRRRLEEEKIPCPTWWNRERGLRNTRTK